MSMTIFIKSRNFINIEVKKKYYAKYARLATSDLVPLRYIQDQLITTYKDGRGT